MLDQTTKKRIDNACDILVGKVPTPLAQVEQITLALIYKFMADMDKRSLSMGGQASYFSGDYEKYSWDNLMDTRIGAQERANLYEEGLNRLSTHSGLPELFRGIFKEASVPYRSSHTLNLFLKEIDGFSYEDSENLGDAYEYLLGKTGSQGEAGQFRTPRHIIDFIVQVVDPNKYDTILDPACGTAGFLISALKHIYRSNTKEIEGDLLSTQELVALSNNVFGYDITPDMVRISRVNMFLHNIKQPHIYEYDTLSSLDRWEDTFSCILANPPFMTPKGGVVPHNRFSIKSTRSEVLFVDYILEHLTLDGKAGIIVPEGIIFQSGKAHKQLRKKLVEENYLVGVISLPSGVFNPYAGVKTSILWIDRSLAKRTDKIIFLKVNNDGFNLGAQRRPIEANDLPDAFNNASAFQAAVLYGVNNHVPEQNVILVNKTSLLESRDYNLNVESHNHKVIHTSTWDVFELRQLVDIVSGGTPDTNIASYWDGSIDWATLVDLPSADFISEITETNRKITEEGLQSSSAKLLPINTVIVSSRATIGRVGINKNPIATNQGFKNLIVKDSTILNYKYLAYMMRSLREKLETLGTGGTYKEVSKSTFESLSIPLPPLSVQEEIVAELDSYQKIIDGARQVIDHWKPRIELDPDWEMVTIGEVTSLVNGRAFTPNDWRKEDSGGIPIIRIQNLNDDKAALNYFVGHVDAKYLVEKGSLLFSWSGSRGTSFGPHIWNKERGILNQHIFLVHHDERYNRMFLYYALKNIVGEVEQNLHGGVGLVHITKGNLEKIKIPLPSITTQQKIVDLINHEQSLVESNLQLISLYKEKITLKINQLWDAP